jgi:hypothetical protein
MRRAVLIGLLALGCSYRPTAPGGGLLTVTNIDVRIAESFPPQVFASVRGELPDPCHAIDEVTQERRDDVITVAITLRRSDAVCPAVIVPVERTVRLEGPLPAGSYVLRVNGLETRFRL